jgi:hypothetical protein
MICWLQTPKALPQGKKLAVPRDGSNGVEKDVENVRKAKPFGGVGVTTATKEHWKPSL